MPKQTWTPEQLDALRQMYPDIQISQEKIEEYFRRSWQAISMKARRLELDRPRKGSWSSQEIDDLRRMYPDLSISLEQMIQHFGRSENAIVTMAYELNIRRRTVELKPWSQEEIEKLREMYADKGVSSQQLQQMFGRSANAISKQARFLGLVRYDHQINHSYFKEIKTNEQAYWLGWLASDGSVRVSKLGGLYITLELHQSDEAVVHAFAQAVAPRATIHRSRKAVSIRIGSKRMAQDLAHYGIVPNKTEIYDWPHALSEAVTLPFILGYFDGDGCLYRSQVPFRNNWTWYLLGTEPFLVAVRDRIESHIQVRLRGPIRADRIRSSFLYKLYTSDKESIRRLDAQINSSGLGLPRKHL